MRSLQHELGYGKSAADVLTRLGKLLESREYPVLAAAVESGTVSNQQAGVIVRKLDSWRKKQDAEFLLLADKSAVEFAEGSEDARAWKPESLEKAMRAWYYEQHPEEAELTTAEQWEQRECFGRMLQDGRVKIDAVIPADEGAAVLQFLDANASPKARFGAPDGDPELRISALAPRRWPTHSCSPSRPPRRRKRPARKAVPHRPCW